MKHKRKILTVSIIVIIALGFGIGNFIISDKTKNLALLKNIDRPNIILIMADDMGYSDIGCYGGEIRTPNLDNLALNGLRFSQFYNTSRCCPTRASLLTGLYPAQTGIGMMTSDEGRPGYRGDLNEQCVTIAEVLKSSGYRTYMSGKWHVTKYLKDVDSLKYNWPRQRGFDKFYGTVSGAGSFWDPYTLARNNSLISPENDSMYRPKQFYYTDAISDNAVSYIQEHKSAESKDPFFMYVAYTAAHWPLHAPEDEIEQYKGQYDKGFDAVRLKRFEKLKQSGLLRDKWEMTKSIANWDTVQNKEWYARNMEVYAAMVTRMDEGIGRIIGELEKTGDLENTLILFLQDNGACDEELEWVGGRENLGVSSDVPIFEPMGENEIQMEMIPKKTRDGYPVVMQSTKVLSGSARTYNAYGPTWANVSNTPFRMYKHWVNEGGISSPLIAYWPSQIKNIGEISHQPSHLIDIMATCVDLAGASYPRNYDGNVITPMEGKSLLPIFLTNEILDRDAIYFEHEGNRAIRQQKWKLVSKAHNNSGYYSKSNELQKDQWELFDMDNDRTEIHDVAKQHPEVVEELSGKWHKWARRTNTIPKPK